VNLLEVLQGANVALKLIQARILTLIAMLVCAALFGVAMWQQTVLGLIIAATWGLVVFLPVLFTGRGGVDGNQGQEREHPSREPTARAPDGARLPEAESDDS
jgi:hypothetical protein